MLSKLTTIWDVSHVIGSPLPYFSQMRGRPGDEANCNEQWRDQLPTALIALCLARDVNWTGLLHTQNYCHKIAAAIIMMYHTIFTVT
jgi:hypothetical protein